MWESPIDAIYDAVQTSFENEVVKAVRSVNIKVDKEELLKALAYDRNQYEKGYADGQRDAKEHGRWILSPDHSEGICTRCNFKIYGRPYQSSYLIVPYDFCPNCGAKMDEEEDNG